MSYVMTRKLRRRDLMRGHPPLYVLLIRHIGLHTVYSRQRHRRSRTKHEKMTTIKRMQFGLVVCNLLVVALLCIYFMIPPPPMVENLTITHHELHFLQGPIISPKQNKLLEKLSEKLTENPPDKLPKNVSNTTVKPPQKPTPKKPSKVTPAPKKLPIKKAPTVKLPPYIKLPQSVIDGVKTFVFFVGHPCSGHSIVASLLDSHPHMVVSHEFTLFQKLSTGSLAPTKQVIFNELWNFDRRNMQWLKTHNIKGYTLMVDGLYEGKYVDHIDVMGDKRGDLTVQLFIDHPSNWSRVYDTLRSLNLTMKVIHVIRNPYDNIASHVFLSDAKKYHAFKAIKHSNRAYTFNSNHTAKSIKMYFQYHQAIVSIKEKYNLDIIEVHGKDLVSDPKGTLSRLCDQIGITCSDDYLEKCSKKVYKTESRTRRLVKWPEAQLELIEQNIKKYSCLEGYTFDSM